MNKIFQIGFNRCGTRSIYSLFNEQATPRLKCLHWEGGNLAYAIMQNIDRGERALAGKFESYDFFADMEVCVRLEGGVLFFSAIDHFDTLDSQYPGSKFILNTRRVDDWIASRMRHKSGNQHYSSRHLDYYRGLPEYGPSLDMDGLKSIWISQWHAHHERVLLYFKDRPEDLLVFDIDNDGIEKFRSFFPELEFNATGLPHKNKS